MKKNVTRFIMVAVMGVFGTVAFVGCTTSNDQDSHKRTAGQYIDDKVLVQKVHSALGDSDIYKFPDVKVNTYNGTVQLSGFVESQEQKRKAEEIAKTVKGVYNVQNNIQMKADTERVRGIVDRTNAPNAVIVDPAPVITTNRTTINP